MLTLRQYDSNDSLADYLAEEERRGCRLELINGALFDVSLMAGGTRAHSRLCSNVARHLGNKVTAASKNCFTYVSEAKIDIARHQRFYYPDASVVCGEEEAGRVAGSYTNPTLIVEVTSASSLLRDLGEKFKCYRALPSLRDYVLISSQTQWVAVYSRPDAKSIMSYQSYSDADEVVALPSLGIGIAVAELYDRVELELSAEGTASDLL